MRKPKTRTEHDISEARFKAIYACLSPEVERLGPDLLAAWETIVREQGTLTAALATLNAACGTTATLTMVSRWRRGEEPVPRAAAAYMRRLVLERLGLSDIAPLLEPAQSTRSSV